jgi:hypothetical protein
MIVALLCVLCAPLLGAWVAVVVVCAQDALAPETAPEPVLYVRRHTLDQYRARRLVTA